MRKSRVGAIRASAGRRNVAWQRPAGLPRAKSARGNVAGLSAGQFLLRCIVGFLGGTTVTLQVLSPNKDGSDARTAGRAPP